MLETLRPTPEHILTEFRYLNPRRRYTICMVLRDLYAEVTDPALRLKIRYAEMVAKAIVGEMEKRDPVWLKNLYPRRSEFAEVMKLEALNNNSDLK